MQSDGILTYVDLRHCLAPLFSPLTDEDPLASNQEGSILSDDQLMSDLSTLFDAVFSNLRASECLRERIAKRVAFDKRASFHYCDRDGDGQLSTDDIKNVLIDHNGAQIAKDKEVYLVLNKFKGLKR